MKLLMSVTFIFGLAFFAVSCKTNAKVSSLTTYTKNMISFSTGGGFTGAETVFTILENGQVFSASALTPEKALPVAQLPAKGVKTYFEKVKQIDWSKVAINDPGNIYHTLAFGTNGNMKKQVWGGGKVIPAKEITDLYTELSNTIAALKK